MKKKFFLNKSFEKKLIRLSSFQAFETKKIWTEFLKSNKYMCAEKGLSLYVDIHFRLDLLIGCLLCL